MKEGIKEIAIEIAKILDSKKAEDIKILDVTRFTSFADYFVIATGGNVKHTVALADEIDKKLSEKNIILKHKEGYTNGKWILLDFIDIIVHIFSEEEREFYDLERIWKGAKYLEFDIDTQS